MAKCKKCGNDCSCLNDLCVTCQVDQDLRDEMFTPQEKWLIQRD
jgi:hypothetical protein